MTPTFCVLSIGGPVIPWYSLIIFAGHTRERFVVVVVINQVHHNINCYFIEGEVDLMIAGKHTDFKALALTHYDKL